MTAHVATQPMGESPAASAATTYDDQIVKMFFVATVTWALRGGPPAHWHAATKISDMVM